MIVVEGIDGSGKTTLANALGEKLGWPVLHWANPGRTDATKLLPFLLNGPTILDRGHLTPQVYGEVLRGKPDLPPYDFWALSGVLKAKGCVTILCDVDLETAWANVRSRPALFEITRAQLARLQGAFRALDLPRFDYREGVEVIPFAAPVEAPAGVVGSPRPSVWLVGDEKARYGPLEEVPFYAEGVAEQLLSGTLLHRAMTTAGLTWEGSALSNSRLWGRDVDLAEVYERLGRPERTVALGNVAAARLAKFGIVHEKALHPQWWRRFRYRDQDGYAEVLAKAVGRPVAAQREAS